MHLGVLTESNKLGCFSSNEKQNCFLGGYDGPAQIFCSFAYRWLRLTPTTTVGVFCVKIFGEYCVAGISNPLPHFTGFEISKRGAKSVA